MVHHPYRMLMLGVYHADGRTGPGDLQRHPGAVIFSVCGSDTVVKLCKHLGRAVEDVPGRSALLKWDNTWCLAHC